LGLAEAEHILDSPAQEEMVRQSSQEAEGKFVLDVVHDHGHVHALPVNCPKAMAMAPPGEGATNLAVAESIIPGELGDLSHPAQPQGKMAERPEAEGEPRPAAGVCRCPWNGRLRIGRVRRRDQRHLFNPRLLPGRQQGRKIVRIGEEGEDGLDRAGEPLFGVMRVAHSVRLDRRKKGVRGFACGQCAERKRRVFRETHLGGIDNRPQPSST